MHVIRSVEVGMNHTVDVVWDDGRETTIDFASIVAKGGVFAAIAERAQFGQGRDWAARSVAGVAGGHRFLR